MGLLVLIIMKYKPFSISPRLRIWFFKLFDSKHLIVEPLVFSNWILVNSKFSQTEIISMSRVNDIIRNINNGEVRILRKEPLDYLKKRLEGVLPKNDKMKVIFTQEFIEKITEK